MSKWRVTVWPKERPKVRLVKYKRSATLQEATEWAVDEICRVMNAHHLDLGTVEFTLEHLDGGIQGWHVKYSSASEYWQKAIENA